MPRPQAPLPQLLPRPCLILHHYSSSCAEDVGPTQVNADTAFAAGTGGPDQPSSSSPGSPSDGEEEGEGDWQAQPTQAADAAQEDEGDPTQRMPPPIPIDQLVRGLCGESTDGASP